MDINNDTIIFNLKERIWRRLLSSFCIFMIFNIIISLISKNIFVFIIFTSFIFIFNLLRIISTIGMFHELYITDTYQIIFKNVFKNKMIVKELKDLNEIKGGTASTYYFKFKGGGQVAFYLTETKKFGINITYDIFNLIRDIELKNNNEHKIKINVIT